MAKISDQEFEDLSKLIMETAGIQLDKGKEYLMEARMEPLLDRYGYDSYNDLYLQAKSDQSGKLKAKIVDAITINETYFFRDNNPFELLKNKIIPDLIDLKSKHYGEKKIPLKIWSAACSTGQEVYSIAMILHEMFIKGDKYDIKILGTDISSEAVARASYGKYNQFEVERGLNPYFLNKYFTKVANGWRIKDELRSLAQFIKMDLNQPFTGIGTFDVIFCRNVAIYFPVSGKKKLFQNIAKILNSGGALIVGGSESLAGLTAEFIPKHYLNGIFYQLRDDKQPYFPRRTPSIESTPTQDRPKPPVQAPVPPPPKPPRSFINERIKAGAEIKEADKTIKVAQPSSPAPIPTHHDVEKHKAPEAVEPKPSHQEPPKKSLLNSLQRKKSSGIPALGQKQSGLDEKKRSLLEILKEREEKEKKDHKE